MSKKLRDDDDIVANKGPRPEMINLQLGNAISVTDRVRVLSVNAEMEYDSNHQMYLSSTSTSPFKTLPDTSHGTFVVALLR